MVTEFYPIAEYPNYYISKNGKVLSMKRGYPKILKPSKNNSGYFKVILLKDGKQKTKHIHRIVAMVFLNDNKPILKPLEVDHIDRNKLNNDLSNLRIVSRYENIKNRNTDTKKWKKANERNLKKAQNKTKKPIKAYDYYTNEFIAEFESITEASKKLNVTLNTIVMNLKGKVKKVGTKKGIEPKRYYVFEYAS